MLPLSSSARRVSAPSAARTCVQGPSARIVAVSARGYTPARSAQPACGRARQPEAFSGPRRTTGDEGAGREDESGLGGEALHADGDGRVDGDVPEAAVAGLFQAARGAQRVEVGGLVRLPAFLGGA